MSDMKCPSWMSQEDFLRCRTDPYRALDAGQRYVNAIRKNILELEASNKALEAHPVVRLAQSKDNFEKLRSEHLILGDTYHNQLQQRNALLNVAEALRGEKRGLLMDINAARRGVMLRRVEYDAAEAEYRRLEGQQKVRAAQVAVQESQIASLTDLERECDERLAAVRAEFSTLTSTLENVSLQTRSLSSLRKHLETTHAEQKLAAEALEKNVAEREALLQSAVIELWDYKTEMSTRVVSLQRLAENRQDELKRMRRLSEHEMDTLAAQNKSLGDELKTTAEALMHVRNESKMFTNTTREKIALLKLDAQRYTGIVELVEEQNVGLRDAIHRAQEQLRQTTAHTSEKDNINNKNLIEQANFISKVHMELQCTLEDLRIVEAQLCTDCRQQLIGESEPMQDREENKKNISLEHIGDRFSVIPPFSPNDVKKDILLDASSVCGVVALPKAEEEEEELSRLRDALDALNRQLLQERATREGERQLEDERRTNRDAIEESTRRADAERLRLERQDATKKDAGEVVLTYTVQFVDGSQKRVDAFPSDTVDALISRVALRAGILKYDRFHLAQLVEEGGIVGTVYRHLQRDSTLLAEGVTPQTVLLLRIKHYKRPLLWDDPVVQEWFFRQLQQHVVCEYYPVGEAVAVRLASYELQAVFGDYTAQKALLYFDQVGLEAYLPMSVSAHTYDYWQQRLAANHRYRSGLTASQARTGYIDVLSTTPWWGFTFFDVRDRDNRPFLAGVAEDGLYIFSTTKQECLDEISFTDLLGWEKCHTGVVVRRRGSSKMTLYGTSQLQAKEMVDLLNEYYMLLPQNARDELCIDIMNMEVVRTTVGNPTLFEFPVVHRPLPLLYESRVEFLKAAYMSFCTELDEFGRQRAPIPALLQAMDHAVDNNTTLHTLDLSGCDPPLDDSHFSALADIFHYAMLEYEPSYRDDRWSENVTITTLLLSQPSAMRQLLTALSVPKISSFAAALPSLQTLDISYVSIDNAAEHLGRALCSGAKQLQRLVLTGCRIGARALQSLLLLFDCQHPSALEHLILEDNFLTHAALHPLCEVIMSGRTVLVELNVAFNRIEPSGIEALVKAVRVAPRLHVLDVSGNPGLHPPSTRAYALVARDTGITRLSLRSCNLQFPQFDLLDTELASNSDITELDLSLNPIGKGVDILAAKEMFRFLRGFGSVNHVEELRMNECSLSEGEVSDALGAALGVNRTLRRVELRGNGLACKTGFLSPLFSDAAGTHPALCVLDLCENNISYAGCMQLFASLVRSSSLRELHMSGNNMGVTTEPASYAELVALLENSASLQVISLSNTGLRDEALQQLGEGLSRNTSVHSLTASGNVFTPLGIAGFARLIQYNTALKTLDLSTEALREDEAVYVDTLRLLSSAGKLDEVLL
ncbi:putative ribonuclease inhibitor [Trypanosoma theileri]|uniref:Putative ribonuclease inhibitor n=1 Tax=Trypanosoma theileri TaxID=67003 RepID=A0A1X0NJN4_9TRYP|nr:putative ribonuclease inhibitor [Trypanosoma theileri]ORC84801.1 putative ribonuclease inhibitor [Trypanosoma theileri]